MYHYCTRASTTAREAEESKLLRSGRRIRSTTPTITTPSIWIETDIELELSDSDTTIPIIDPTETDTDGDVRMGSSASTPKISKSKSTTITGGVRVTSIAPPPTPKKPTPLKVPTTDAATAGTITTPVRVPTPAPAPPPITTPPAASTVATDTKLTTGVCELCQQLILLTELALHRRRCGGDEQACVGCDQYFPLNDLQQHQPLCLIQAEAREEDEIASFVRLRQEMHTIGQLTLAQLNALQHVVAMAKQLSDGARPGIITRFKSFGYDSHHLRTVLRFIRHHAPLIIHVNLGIRMKLLNDTHYRSQFETGTSCGSLSPSSRTAAESNMFGGHYTSSTASFDRVKYGALNHTADPTGVMSAAGYGDSVLHLKNETIRARITIAHCDTLGTCPPLGTCEYFCHVLQHYSDVELLDLIRVALGEKRYARSQVAYVYKEIQIHGPIQLDRDLTALSINHRHVTEATTMTAVEEFRKRTKIEVIQMEPKRTK